jgi:hypothetical protein
VVVSAIFASLNPFKKKGLSSSPFFECYKFL